MIRVRRSDERGHADYGWLDTRHSFSFGDYYDPNHMGFRTLRVINEDRVAPGEGFPRHPHRDMEILTYVLEGALAHRDSLGNGSVVQAGELQRMSAGTGVSHSEYNDSASDSLRFLQIWIVPERRGIPPSYEQRRFDDSETRGRLRLAASPDAADGSLTLHQNARLYVGRFGAGDRVAHGLAPGRHAWVQVTRGRVRLAHEELGQGDGAAISEEGQVELEALEEAEVLLFDMD